jgi:hypothetical protein
MRVIRGVLTAIVFVVLAMGVYLLVIDPRLRSLVEEDLSAMIPKTESPKAGGGPTTAPNEGRRSVVAANGSTISSECALWTVEGVDLYYSPADPATICVQTPGSSVQAGSRYSPETMQLPPNCSVAPDSVVYCRAEGELGADTLQAFYNSGELNTPREPGKGAG